MIDETTFGKGAADKPSDFLKPEAPLHAEVAGAYQPTVWAEKDPAAGFTTYPKRNQGIKSDCTCYAGAKALSIDELGENGQYREFSPDSVYPYVVVPGGGANSLDVIKFIDSNGMTLEALYPSDSLTEAQASNPAVINSNIVAKDAKQVALIYRPSSYVECATDFDTIAGILHNYQVQGIKKGVMITIVGQNNGTWASTMPQVPSKASTSALWYHRIVVTDFGLIKGQKVLAFDNSWGDQVGNKGQQFLTEAYMPFMYGGIYTINQPDVADLDPMAKPSHVWTAPLTVGDSGNDVLMLQTALQSVGMFPVSSILKPTGYFGGLTKNGVQMFQAAFILPVTGIVDEATVAALNGMFK